MNTCGTCFYGHGYVPSTDAAYVFCFAAPPVWDGREWKRPPVRPHDPQCAVWCVKSDALKKAPQTAMETWRATHVDAIATHQVDPWLQEPK